ncbi:MAG: GAF domain-containing protein, partial [Chloroflexi bacterium]|nr:GAF domain-containing protein [Chloroflexota bacterium]
MAENLREVFWIREVNEDKILYVSPAYEEVWGHTRQSLYQDSTSFMEPVHPDDKERVIAAYQSLRQDGIFDEEYRIIQPNGSIRWIWARSLPVTNEAGEIVRITGIAEDVTQRKQHERELEAIAAVSSAIRKAANLNELVPNVLDQLQSLMSSKNALLAIHDASYEECNVMCARGDWEDMNGLRLPAALCQPHRNIHTRNLDFTNTFKTKLLSHSKGYQPNLPILGVPLISQGQTIGSLWICYKQAQARTTHIYSEEENRLLRLVADITASAIQREILNEQTAKRALEFSLLYQAARKIAAEQDPKRLLEISLDYATQLLNSPCGGIFLYDSTRNDLVLEHVRGKAEALRGLRVPIGAGTVGKAAQTLKPVIANHYSSWSNRLPEFEELSLGAVISVPLLHAGELIGIINIQEYSTKLFSENDSHLLSLLANLAASAIYDTRLFNETVRRLAEMEVLSRVSTALRLAIGRDEIFAVLLDTTLQVLDSEHGAILIKNQGEEEFTVVLTRGTLSNLQSQKVPVTTSLAGYAFKSNQIYVTRNLQHDPRRNETNVPHEVGPGMAIPLRTGEITLGLLFVGRTIAPDEAPDRSFKSSEVQLAQTIAEIASSAIHRAELYEETLRHAEQMTSVTYIGRALAETLELSEIYNRLTKAIFDLLPDIATVLITLFDPQSKTIAYVYGARDDQPVDISHLPVLKLDPNGKGALDEVIHTRKPLIQNRISQKQSAELAIGEERPIQSALYVPMLAKGETQGILQVNSYTQQRFHPADADLLTLVGNTAAIAMANAALFKDVQHANEELIQAYDTTLEGWARALELRDQETEGHSKRVAALTLRLAQAAGIKNETLDHVRRGALLHDIGKMGIPDSILLKPGPLTPEERTIIEKHPVYAYQLLSPIAYLQPALEIPYCHHEKWNGSGYPRGLKGTQIPLAARIFALIDVWDALRSERPYRPAWSDEAALEYISSQSAIHFDPDLVKLFMRLVEEDPTFS